jgi:hypothetical protein
MTQFVLGNPEESRHGKDRPTRELQKVSLHVKGFDYESLAGETRERVLAHTSAINTLRQRLASDAVEIGKRLCQVRDELGPRLFGVYLAAEFHWTQSVASNLMAIARRFGEMPPEQLSNFDVSALYELARDRVPEEARSEALQLAASGQKVSQRVAYTITERHQAAAADRELQSRAKAPAARVSSSGNGWRPRSTSASVGGDEETWARLSPKVRREVTNFKSTARQLLRGSSGADREQMAALLAAGIRDVFEEFELDEHFLANSAAAQPAAPRLKAAARAVRAAGIPITA